MYSTHDYRHYCRRLLVLIAVTLMATGSWAQEAETREEDTSETAAASEQAESAAATDDADEEVIVDEGSYLDGDDDDFKPSEEISADRSITFPTDI